MASLESFDPRNFDSMSIDAAIRDPYLKSSDDTSRSNNRNTFSSRSAPFQGLNCDTAAVNLQQRQNEGADAKNPAHSTDPLRLRYPLSPPESATVSPKQWPFNPSNVYSNEDFTDIQNTSSTYAMYGQMTPPDEQDDNQADSNADYSAYDSTALHSQTIPRFHGESDMHNENRPKSKRNRKTTNKGHDKHVSDTRDPNDMRRSKFLERNRVAASKCRQKKKEWTQNLETRARELQAENNNLHLWLDSMRDEYMFLKTQIAEHRGCDSQAINAYLDDPKRDLLAFNNPASRNILQSLRDKKIKREHDDDDAASSLTGSISNDDDDDALGALLADSLNDSSAG